MMILYLFPWSKHLPEQLGPICFLLPLRFDWSLSFAFVIYHHGIEASRRLLMEQFFHHLHVFFCIFVDVLDVLCQRKAAWDADAFPDQFFLEFVIVFVGVPDFYGGPCDYLQHRGIKIRAGLSLDFFVFIFNFLFNLIVFRSQVSFVLVANWSKIELIVFDVLFGTQIA